MEVIGYGDADVDVFLTVDKIPERDEKILAKGYSFQIGGMVANTMVALSRLSRSVGFHGKIGDDAFGQTVLENLNANNVDTAGVLIIPGGDTFFCVVLLDRSGEKALISAPTDCRDRSPEDVSEKYISQAQHLHTTAIFLPAAEKAIDFAKNHGLTVSLDLDAGKVQLSDDVWDLLSSVDILFINRRGAHLIGNSPSIDEAARNIVSRTLKTVCITLGNKGSITATAEDYIKTDPFNVNVVDTTGAGDCFAAGFIHGYLSKWSIKSIALFANAVAAISITSIGGHTGAPHIEEVITFLKKNATDIPELY
jgi:ribokinase